MESLDIGRRLVIICSFLLALWFILNYIVLKVKSGKWHIPAFLLNKFKFLENIVLQQENKQPHSLDIIQRRVFTDGLELFVIEADGRRILASRTPQGSVSYIAELELSKNKNII
jgi:hypothetical protein